MEKTGFFGNDGMQWELKKGNAVITGYMYDDEHVEFPAEIEGHPVTELGPYVLSGKKAREVVLPDSVMRVGRYGFYNCRNLESLSFSSTLTDIGSGCFTGCHKLSRLHVHLLDRITVLKEVVSEVTEELCVTMSGLQEAVLWFPEYYEEGIEDTPARIIRTEFHGSGLYYRNCFQGKTFNFPEYDSRFNMARAQEKEPFIMELVCGRLMYPQELSDRYRAEYEDWLKAHFFEMLKSFIGKKRETETEWLLNTYPQFLTEREKWQELTELAAGKEVPALGSILMDYGRKYFPPKRKKFVF